MSLPEYPLGSAAASQVDISRPPLPGYSRTTTAVWDVPPAEQEHHFHLTDKKTGAQWLTLTVLSRAESADGPPVFYQGGNIAGSVALELEKEVLIDEVTLTLYGRLSIFSHSTSNFFYMSQTLYSAAEQSPDLPTMSFLKRGKLKGRYDWPFSLRLPKGVSILSAINPDSRVERANYRLPPSFSDEQSNVHVKYTLIVNLNRGGFKAGSKLTVPLTYIPLARPSAPTIIRQLAYQEEHPLVGPDGDPDGWKALDTVKVRGVLFKTIPVEAKCRIHVSKPLSYTRGGPIHLLCTVKCDNPQLLDLLTPQSLRMTLVQRITFGDAVQKARFSERLATQVIVKSYDRANASWWRTPSEDSLNGKTKVFAGELIIPEELVPACQILHYGHEYELAFRGWSVVGFTPNVDSKKPLLTEPVGVVTAFAQAPRPRSYIPPEYKT